MADVPRAPDEPLAEPPPLGPLIEWVSQRQALSIAGSHPLDPRALASLGRARRAFEAAERLHLGVEPLPGGEAPELVVELLAQCSFWALLAAAGQDPPADLDSLVEASLPHDAARDALARLREANLDDSLLRRSFSARGLEPPDKLSLDADRALPILRRLIDELDARATPPPRIRARRLRRAAALALVAATIALFSLLLGRRPRPPAASAAPSVASAPSAAPGQDRAPGRR